MHTPLKLQTPLCSHAQNIIEHQNVCSTTLNARSVTLYVAKALSLLLLLCRYLLRQRQLQIGYKPVTHGPPGLAQPLQKIPNSEGRDVFFQGYTGSWDSGHMSGYGKFV
jgi:hypothetical protein